MNRSLNRSSFEEDILDHDVLRRLAADAAITACREDLSGSVVTLKVRYTGFETHSRQRKRRTPTQDEREILKTAWSPFCHGKLPRKPLRLNGVGIRGWGPPSSITSVASPAICLTLSVLPTAMNFPSLMVTASTHG